MKSLPSQDAAKPSQRLQALAEFRFQLRRFLQFSENAAHGVKLHPRQHQLLLQVAGAPDGCAATIAYAAKRLGLRHNSVVELVNRSAQEGLLVRTGDPEDRRRVVLRITPAGRQILKKLSEYHARELHELGPALIRSLKRIRELNPKELDPKN
jgi:DNA-binding MarR family transcriptional regulator